MGILGGLNQPQPFQQTVGGPGIGTGMMNNPFLSMSQPARSDQNNVRCFKDVIFFALNSKKLGSTPCVIGRGEAKLCILGATTRVYPRSVSHVAGRLS